MKTVVVLGASGMAGTMAVAELSKFYRVVPVTRASFDILTDRPCALPLDGADAVVNLAGLVNKRLDLGEAAFFAVNAVFPHALAELCLMRGIRLIHLSTDCVFDGRGAPHDEWAAPTATDLYGRSKALGEPCSAMTLRASIIGPEKSNFYNLLCWALRQQKIDGFSNHLWNGITTLTLARCLHAILDQDLYNVGVQHLYSEDVTKLDLLRMICDVFDHDVPITPVEAPQPRDMRLRSCRPEVLAALAIPSLRQQLLALRSNGELP